MNYLTPLSLTVPEYCSLEQAVLWIVTRKQILEPLYFNETQKKLFSLLQPDDVDEATQAIFIALCEGYLVSEGKRVNSENSLDHVAIDDPAIREISPDEWRRFENKEGLIEWRENRVFDIHSDPEEFDEGYIGVRLKTEALVRLFGTKDELKYYGYISENGSNSVRPKGQPKLSTIERWRKDYEDINYWMKTLKCSKRQAAKKAAENSNRSLHAISKGHYFYKKWLEQNG
jgi:hypothetical protein